MSANSCAKGSGCNFLTQRFHKNDNTGLLCNFAKNVEKRRD